MTKYAVTIESEGEGPQSRSTDDMDAALDWFTNAATEVMDAESEVSSAAITVDGQVWGLLREGGVSPPPGGEAVPLRRVV